MFRPVDRHGNVSSRQLNPGSIARILKAMARRAGLDDENISGHSLRSGMATQAAMNGGADEDRSHALLNTNLSVSCAATFTPGRYFTTTHRAVRPATQTGGLMLRTQRKCTLHDQMMPTYTLIRRSFSCADSGPHFCDIGAALRKSETSALTSEDLAVSL